MWRENKTVSFPKFFQILLNIYNNNHFIHTIYNKIRSTIFWGYSTIKSKWVIKGLISMGPENNLTWRSNFWLEARGWKFGPIYWHFHLAFIVVKTNIFFHKYSKIFLILVYVGLQSNQAVWQKAVISAWENLHNISGKIFTKYDFMF